ncbi:hypothetical protein BGZ70_004478, partial [Mortierella alpina]
MATSNPPSGMVVTLAQTLSQAVTRPNAKKLLLTYLLYAVIKYRRTSYGARPRPELKGPKGYPLIGNLLE